MGARAWRAGRITAVCVGLSVACRTTDDLARSNGRSLPFRAMLQGYPAPEAEVFWNKQYWEGLIRGWSEEGYTAVVWYGPNEFTNGQQLLLRLEDFPEARELAPEESERLIEHLRWLFRTCAERGLQSFLLTQQIFFTKAFGQAHGLDVEMEVSPEVSHWHSDGYPDFWRPERGPVHNCGVRNEWTRAYCEALYAEVARIYPELDGFWGYLGEPLPGERSTWFREAVAPGLLRSGRRPLYVAVQWQVPLDSFLANVVGQYEPMWLGFHGYNSEQITDAKPYPAVVTWSERTGLPTVPDIYPANQNWLPFNSPRFAYDIANELKRVDGVVGFLYYERHVSGTLLGPLFRKALARYAASSEVYSDEPWVDLLAAQFGSREAGRHFVAAYNAAGRIIPETCALVYAGGDVMRKELRLPYAFFAAEHPWQFTTSPAREARLIPIEHYAAFVARDPDRYRDNDGSDPTRFPFYQQPVWGSEGGSEYNVLPTQHMNDVRALGELCWEEAEAALPYVTQNLEQAERIRDLMQVSSYLASYYERKVAAAIAALVYARSRRLADRDEAERLAEEALQDYLEMARFMEERLNPYYREIAGSELHEAGATLAELIESEREDRRNMARIFGWDP